MAMIIDGKTIAAGIREEVRVEVDRLKREKGITPALAVILVGDNPASRVYVKNKGKASSEAGILSIEHILPQDAKEKEILSLISRLNNDPSVHGILVQLPLPAHLDEHSIVEAVSPQKDVDGFHPYNIGRLVAGRPTFEPCTPKGIMKLLDATGVPLSGKEAIVIGRSNIVGKPLALMLLKRDSTVTICHSKTENLPEKIHSSDIVIAAIGKAGFVKGEWIKQGAVVIDVGINRTDKGLVGDVEFREAGKRASYITPVPGGVGPMTIAMLLSNTVEAVKNA
ncbi:MAG TPA: bifunctional methylenetetrahydrofolate dehydrogenase/methenyltetrahydrofolate cyclohydrolase FolD [Thermodesulfobacteriota bacterium]|nr:bifunctional methylenetetrahydrofolate dehydrogenase/methenyltetrahydrofolate cyclohydrolase FolD [Thermodesulfobacteriota bacterium]